MSRIALLVASILVGLLILELGCRLHRGPQWLVDWKNLVAEEHGFENAATEELAVRDPLLGTQPRPKVDRFMMPGADGPPLLATGDSFTFGEDVDIKDSWPAILQGLLKRQVLNGGVSGYGFDQTVLRTEILAKTYRPTALIVSFIADDLWRLDMRRVWGRDKPYFTLAADGTLVLHPPIFHESRLSFWQRAFGWSTLVQTVVGRLMWHDEWDSDHARAGESGQGERVVCPLMARLAEIGLPTLVVAQYEPTEWLRKDAVAYNANQLRLTRLALDCAQKAGLPAFDTHDAVDAAVRREGLTAIYGARHHAAGGNRAIAEAIAQELKRRGMLNN